jgi:hypothetical protein
MFPAFETVEVYYINVTTTLRSSALPIYARSAKTSLCAIVVSGGRKIALDRTSSLGLRFRSFLSIDNPLAASARAALDFEVIGSPHQWEFAGMAGSWWNFGGLWRWTEMRVTQKKPSDTNAHTQREYQRKIGQWMYK